ncbi:MULTISPECIES: Mammalian taste receptor protein (TAS2R) [Photorhabdus]|uniref:Mammalian taste receptor protein (TAS2R) n=1 Tax=Photorhabdus TaxID=29487 RepID=UPI002B4B9F99|nr:Mammalian taste receptor protein (TAS2R) [Photorhabdus bodei]
MRKRYQDLLSEHQYMSRFFNFASKNKIGLGGPDIVPYQSAQMKNAYPFFNRYKGKLDLVTMAVQEPTLTYTNPKTKKPFTEEEFTNFAENYLGANIIFWSTTTPWLKQ